MTDTPRVTTTAEWLAAFARDLRAQQLPEDIIDVLLIEAMKHLMNGDDSDGLIVSHV